MAKNDPSPLPPPVSVPPTPSIPTRLIPTSRWNEFHAWPPPGGLRWLIFNADRNGFARCVKRVGTTVLIDEREFLEFVEEQTRLHKSRLRRKPKKSINDLVRESADDVAL